MKRERALPYGVTAPCKRTVGIFVLEGLFIRNVPERERIHARNLFSRKCCQFCDGRILIERTDVLTDVATPCVRGVADQILFLRREGFRLLGQVREASRVIGILCPKSTGRTCRNTGAAIRTESGGYGTGKVQICGDTPDKPIGSANARDGQSVFAGDRDPGEPSGQNFVQIERVGEGKKNRFGIRKKN